MADNPTLQIPRDVIEPIIQAHIGAAVAQAMGSQQQMIQQFIGTVMSAKVDERGQTSTYSTSLTWLQWALRDVVQKAARAALEEEIGKHHERLRAGIVADLNKKNSPLAKQLAAAMVDGMTKAATDKWRLTISVNTD